MYNRTIVGTHNPANLQAIFGTMQRGCKNWSNEIKIAPFARARSFNLPVGFSCSSRATI